MLLYLLFGDVVPESVGGDHYDPLDGLRRVELVIATVGDIRNWLFLLRVAIALYEVVFATEDLIRHVELSLLLLGDEVAAGWAENTEDRVSNVVAPE